MVSFLIVSYLCIGLLGAIVWDMSSDYCYAERLERYLMDSLVFCFWPLLIMLTIFGAIGYCIARLGDATRSRLE